MQTQCNPPNLDVFLVTTKQASATKGCAALLCQYIVYYRARRHANLELLL